MWHSIISRKVEEKYPEFVGEEKRCAVHTLSVKPNCVKINTIKHIKFHSDHFNSSSLIKTIKSSA